jgi:Zn finger protein HypA/HybF involved in hydrogenase expression
MAHIWTNNTEGKWAMHTLAGETSLSVATGDEVRFDLALGQPTQAETRLLPPDAAGLSPCWALLGGRDATLRVNGEPLVLGAHALRDRDEVSFAVQRCFFSTEELAHIVPFPGLAQPAHCPRCKQEVKNGTLAVTCPHCRAWHHQSEEFPCWTYETTCALCRLQPTALDTGYAWTPEML